MLIFLFLSLCYIIAFYFSTILTNYYSPLLMVGLRGLVAGSILLTMQYITTKNIVGNIKQYKYQYLLAIFFGFLLPFILNSTILDQLPPVDISVIATVEPVLTYLLAAYFFKEKLGKKQIFYLFFGTFFAFIAIIAEAGTERISLISWQEPMVILIAIVFAIGWLAIEKLIRQKEPANVVTGLGLMFTGMIATLLALRFGHTKFSVAVAPTILFLLMVIFGDLIVSRIRAKIMNQYSATLLSLICIFSPFAIALYEEISKHTHYSYKFFLIIIPSLICFVAFYREETKMHIKG